MSNKDIVQLFRYVRPVTLDLTTVELVTNPGGGISFLFEIDQNLQTLKYATVVCRDDENFDYNVSKKIAEGRFNKGVYRITHYIREVSLVENVLLHLKNAATLNNTEMTLKSKLKEILSNNQLQKDVRDNIITQVTNKHSEIVQKFSYRGFEEQGLILTTDK